MHWRTIHSSTMVAIGVAILLCVVATPAYASWNAGNYLKFGVGARALGMGNAFVAVADDATAIYWNPAGITQSDKTRLFVSYAERFGVGVQDQNAGIAFHWRDELYVGFGFIRSHVGEIKASPERRSSRERPVVTGLFEDSEVALTGTGAIRFSERVSLGATVKLLTHELAGKRADGIGFDFGILLHPLPALSLGLNAQNINRPRMSWSNETSHFDRIPANFKVGGSYTIADGRLRFSSDLNIPDSDDLNLDVGAEYSPLQGFAMRGGLSSADIGTGASVSWQDVRIDYAYHIHDIGDTHRFSLGYEF